VSDEFQNSVMVLLFVLTFSAQFLAYTYRKWWREAERRLSELEAKK